VRATKRSLFAWSQTARAKPKERKEKGRKILKAVAKLAKHTVEQSRKVLQALARSRSEKSVKGREKFTQQIELTERVLSQTDEKLQGKKSIPERIVSFHDACARAICKGKLNRPVEFGRTLQLVQDSSGVIVHYEVHGGNPNDKTQLLSLVRQTKKRLGVKPKELAADRGYYSAENVRKLKKTGIQRVGIPKVGRLTAKQSRHQHSKWFRALQRFRCGIEAGISMLKRKFSLGRVLARGSPGTAIWTGLAIFAYNLWQQR
jgi:IS5 family transposase